MQSRLMNTADGNRASIKSRTVKVKALNTNEKRTLISTDHFRSILGVKEENLHFRNFTDQNTIVSVKTAISSKRHSITQNTIGFMNTSIIQQESSLENFTKSISSPIKSPRESINDNRCGTPAKNLLNNEIRGNKSNHRLSPPRKSINFETIREEIDD